MTDEAADVLTDKMLIEGDGLSTEVAQAITGADLKRTIDGAPTLTLTIRDEHRQLLRSGQFARRITIQTDGHAFELAQLKKSGNDMILTFEDIAVAELRRHDTPRKADANTVSRVDFGRMLLQEVPWVHLFVDPSVHEQKAKIELARGQVAEAAVLSSSSLTASVDPNYFSDASSATTSNSKKQRAHAAKDEVREDTWTCLQRIFSEVGWRCYADTGNIYVGPDSAFIDKPSAFTFIEGENGVDWIDFDWDVGKAIATCTVKARSSRWICTPGTPVTIPNMGIPDKWLVAEISRSLFSVVTTITVKSPEPELPEPDPPPTPSSSVDGGVNADYFGSASLGSTGAVGTGGPDTGIYTWPVGGTITSPFGQRARNFHEGLDIAAPTGTPIHAARSGTVTFAGSQSGYGNVVYLSHAGGDETRYGHMSRIGVRRGMQVGGGAVIGAVGQTGDATGPHCHFEIRKGGRAVDPLPILNRLGPTGPFLPGKRPGGGASGTW